MRGAPQRFLHHIANFLTDQPVRLQWFKTLSEWSVILFLRSPALVLMYSATNDSMVMPSYPLEPTSALYFKFLQVALAILIITQTALPLVGAVVIGTWIYLWRWGWMVAFDAIPVVTVAVLYITSPWNSHKLAITRLLAQMMGGDAGVRFLDLLVVGDESRFVERTVRVAELPPAEAAAERARRLAAIPPRTGRVT